MEGTNQPSKGKSKEKKDKKGKSKKPKIAGKHKGKIVLPKDSNLTKDVKGHSSHFKTMEDKEY